MSNQINKMIRPPCPVTPASMVVSSQPNDMRQRRAPKTLHHQKGGILGHLFRGGIDINIKNQTFSFSSVEDFKAFLAGKTEIPASKMQEMLARSGAHLKEEIKQLGMIQQTINGKLAATIRDPQTIDTYLYSATMVRFSQDYDWRQIMFELSKQSSDYSEYKLEAVTFYVKYLSSRINIGRNILKNKPKSKPHKDGKVRLTEAHVISADDLQAMQKTGDLETSGSKAFASTYSNLPAQKTGESIAPKLKRIPRGETVVVDASSTSKIPLKLASAEFVLEISNPPKLVSKDGKNYLLKPGENLIGRSSKCSAVLNPELMDVSRRHLIIELHQNNSIHLTDISSAGSQLPANLVKKLPRA